ncbi:hypothetical protein, partial [Arthrobacter cavernae]
QGGCREFESRRPLQMKKQLLGAAFFMPEDSSQKSSAPKLPDDKIHQQNQPIPLRRSRFI